MGYFGRALVQATLPYREPDKALPIWSRRSGNMHLVIKPGYAPDPKTGAMVSLGYPYGSYPRLLLAWIATEVAWKKEQTLVLGHSMAEFLSKIGIDSTSGGKTGNRTRMRQMMTRLFSADLAVVTDNTSRGSSYNLDLNKLPLIENAHMFWSRNDSQQALWQSTITLSQTFFDELRNSPVPIDLRALKALRQSPIEIDLYCWLTYRYSYLKKATEVPWEALELQFGSGTENRKNFRDMLLRALRKVLDVYPQARVAPTRDGLRLEPSRTSVARVVVDWEPKAAE